MSQNEDRSIERRLERIESNVFQLKVILLVTLVILVIGVIGGFGPSAVVRVVGMTVLCVGIFAGAFYAGLRILDVLVQRKMGSEEEREEQMKDMILGSITSESKTDMPGE